MYISELRISNFRLFGTGDDEFVLSLNPGLTALVGENDAGKTAVIDAIRLVLGTRDQDMLRVDQLDFHQARPDAQRADQIEIRLTFRDLNKADRAAFAEFLTFEEVADGYDTILIITWVAKRPAFETGSRRGVAPEWRTGAKGDGPLLDFGARSLLTATYLRPLRDAERAMSAGRGSRLSQILQHTKEIQTTGVGFDPVNPPNDPGTLSVLGLGDYAGHLFGKNDGIRKARERLNKDYLAPLSFAHDPLKARISVASAQDELTRLRQLLEKLELSIAPASHPDLTYSRGLGSNNLLFMACELLLLGTEEDGFPLLLIEEPEAHLHPQRQVRLMSFLLDQAAMKRKDDQQIQIIVTTHSPNLASDLPLDNLVLIEGGRAFPLSRGMTELSTSDYRFLERFLDVTKANLFFARAVLIVEGDAENILMPVIAKLLGRDFHQYGVSVVNVGGVGLGRFARIFMRKNPERDGELKIRVACVTDMDVMPDVAPWIVGKLKEGVELDRPPGKRRWRVKADFTEDGLERRRAERTSAASGQNVHTFVSDEWTLEYDLALYGLARQVFVAARLALADDRIGAGKVDQLNATVEAEADFLALKEKIPDREELCSHVYALFEARGASKAIAAQYLAEILYCEHTEGKLSVAQLLSILPAYIVAAIEHVTAPFAAAPAPPAGEEKEAAA